MIKNIYFPFLWLMLTVSGLHSQPAETYLDSQFQTGPQIYIHNRILAKINGKPISTYDLMKKMDVSFFRQYPEYASSNAARAQYYDMSWKYALEDLIDKELILADAQESKIEVSSGDVRQELEASFGPNIIANLDKAGVSFDDASKMMREELIIRKMVGGRVHVKALRQVTPNRLKQLYEEFQANPANARHTQWIYRTLTVKDKNLKKSEEVANQAHQLLMKGTSLETLPSQLEAMKALGKKTTVTLSNTIINHDHELAPAYREVLKGMEPGSFSPPFKNKNRTTRATVYRILVLDKKIPGGVPTYKEMEATLKQKLTDQMIDQETSLYLNKLRNHYHINNEEIEAHLPSNYQPFTLS